MLINIHVHMFNSISINQFTFLKFKKEYNTFSTREIRSTVKYIIDKMY